MFDDRHATYIPFNARCFLRTCCGPSSVLGVRDTKKRRVLALYLIFQVLTE